MDFYTSPDTNKTYSIKKITSMRGNPNSKGENALRQHIHFDIYDGERKVQFALTEDQIADSVKHYEFPGWDGLDKWASARD